MTAHTTWPARQSWFHMITHSSTVQQTRSSHSVYRQGNRPGLSLNPQCHTQTWPHTMYTHTHTHTGLSWLNAWALSLYYNNMFGNCSGICLLLHIQLFHLNSPGYLTLNLTFCWKLLAIGYIKYVERYCF